jgi:hypothetical protein
MFHDGLDQCHSVSTDSAQRSVSIFGMYTAAVHRDHHDNNDRTPVIMVIRNERFR